jgi:CubicO group peptidase (beta-lactamase class C family)
MNPNTLNELIKQRIEKAISEKVFPCCVVGYVTPLAGQNVVAFGRHSYEDASRPIETDSIFDVASITKSIPTSSLALQLIDRGKLRLNDKLIQYLPEFNNSSREKVLIRHLLTQTLCHNFRLSALKNLGPDGILQAILTTDFSGEPGSAFFYSNATSILLGIVVERVYGECLAVSAKREFFSPLGMMRTSFFSEELPNEQIVPTEIDPWRNRIIQGEVHDESAFVLRQKMVAGSAGLFSTAPDLIRFLKMLLNGGTVEHKCYFSSDIIRQLQTNQIPELGLHAGLGWELFQKRYMGNFCTTNTLGKTGFTGCVCLCDIPKKTAMALLANYTFPVRKPDTRAIDSVRRDIANIIFSL